MSMAHFPDHHGQYEMLHKSQAYTSGPSEVYYGNSPQPSTEHAYMGPSNSNSILTDTKHPRVPTSRFARWRQISTTYWLLEFGSWLLGCASLAAIVGVLLRFEGESVPSLTFGITLGALVSVLSTIATVFLTVPLAAGIAQGRWIWFQKQRRLADFELITNASRSPFASFWLILRWKGGKLTIFGALWMIILLAVNPFAQQVIEYGTRPHSSVPATVPTTDIYNVNADGGIPTVDVNLPMKAAIARGMLDIDANTSTFDVKPFCATGNCTWPVYQSLTVCGRCADLTNQLSPITKDTQTGYSSTSLPNGLNISWIDAVTDQGFVTMTINNTLSTSGLDTIAFPDANYSMVDVFAIVAPQPDIGPYASECVLQFCAQNMSASSSNGIFTESVVGSPRYVDQDYGSYDIYNEDNGHNWTVEYETWNGLATYFLSTFDTFVQQTNSLGPRQEWPNDVSQAMFHHINGSAHTPQKMFDNIAKSMGQRIRAVGNGTQVGITLTQESFVVVRWPWMILPLIILLAVLIFLIASVIATRRAGLKVWKESSIAVLFHGLNDESRAPLRGVEKVWQMDHMADSMQMKFGRFDDRLHLKSYTKQL